MTRTHTKATVAIILTIMGVVCSASWGRQSSATTGDAALRQVVADFTEAFNHHDAHAVAILFTGDADFTNFQGTTTHGQKQLEQTLMSLFVDRLKNAHTSAVVSSIRLLTPEVASVNMNCELTGTKSPRGDPLPSRRGIYNWILVKQNGRWLISVFHESELPSPPALVPVH
jgi:uncharacterized protein (TIGR02246 family)